MFDASITIQSISRVGYLHNQSHSSEHKLKCQEYFLTIEYYHSCEHMPVHYDKYKNLLIHPRTPSDHVIVKRLKNICADRDLNIY